MKYFVLLKLLFCFFSLKCFSQKSDYLAVRDSITPKWELGYQIPIFFREWHTNELINIYNNAVPVHKYGVNTRLAFQRFEIQFEYNYKRHRFLDEFEELTSINDGHDLISKNRSIALAYRLGYFYFLTEVYAKPLIQFIHRDNFIVLDYDIKDKFKSNQYSLGFDLGANLHLQPINLFRRTSKPRRAILRFGLTVQARYVMADRYPIYTKDLSNNYFHFGLAINLGLGFGLPCYP